MKEDVIRAHAELPALCEHIHLPLQSGSSAVLKRMRRTYDRGRYMDRVALIREHVPDCAITTDIIVGFPGETEADFEQTLEVVEEVGYDGAFTFVFSPRRETEAATIGRPGAAPGQARADGAAGRAGPAPRRRARAALRRPRRWRCWSKGRAAPTRPGCAGRTRHNKAVNFDGCWHHPLGNVTSPCIKRGRSHSSIAPKAFSHLPRSVTPSLELVVAPAG